MQPDAELDRSAGRRQLERALAVADRLVPAPLVEVEHRPQPGVRLEERAVDLDGPRGGDPCATARLAGRQEPPEPEHRECLGDPNLGHRIRRIDRDRLVERRDRRLEVDRTPAVEEVAAAQVQVVGLAAGGVVTCQRTGLSGQQLDLEPIDDAERDFVLEREDFGVGAVESLGPEVKAAPHLDELRGDAQLLAGLANAPLEHGVDAEPAADLAA